MINIYNYYDKMERSNTMLAFKGAVTSDLLDSILQIMENKLESLKETPKVKRKVFNVLVECLQNLYHHIDDVFEGRSYRTIPEKKSAIFMIGRVPNGYNIVTGNFIVNSNVDVVKDRIDRINDMDRSELKEYYQQVLNNGQRSAKGGSGLGFIDIARKSGQKLKYNFMDIDDASSFFSLNVLVLEPSKTI